jgi:hypothetical protein
MASDCAKRTSSRWRRSLANDEPLHRRRPAFTEGWRSGSQYWIGWIFLRTLDKGVASCSGSSRGNKV